MGSSHGASSLGVRLKLSLVQFPPANGSDALASARVALLLGSYARTLTSIVAGAELAEDGPPRQQVWAKSCLADSVQPRSESHTQQ